MKRGTTIILLRRQNQGKSTKTKYKISITHYQK